jgi:hypothetical protein
MSFAITVGMRGSLLKKTKGFGKALKESMQKAMTEWQEGELPKHFAPIGQFQSRYPGVGQPRTRKYQIYKNKKYHQQNIMEWSGELKDNVRRNRVVVTGSKKTFKARLPGSQKANFRSKAASPDMRDELTAISEAEAKAIDQTIDREMTEFLHPQRDDPYETFMVT